MSKRRKTATRAVPTFGAPNEDDDEMTAMASSDSVSTRTLPATTVPSLLALCMRRFVEKYTYLRQNPEGRLWRHTSQSLHMLPEPLLPRIFAMLSQRWPTFLPDNVIQPYFMRDVRTIVLSDALTDVKKQTINSLKICAPHLSHLELSGFAKFEDNMFAGILSHLPELKTLNLRGCKEVGHATVEAAANHCPDLEVANFNYTSVTPFSLQGLLVNCKHLRVLKVAGISSWSDGTLQKLLAALSASNIISLPALHNLKLRQLSLSNTSTTPFVALFPNLRRLDISFTNIQHIPTSSPFLEKLALSSTPLAISFGGFASPSTSYPFPVEFLQLRTLNIGALGQSAKSSGALVLTDGLLMDLTDVLAPLEHLEHVSLASNAKLTSNSISEFMNLVGRRCKTINLSGIPRLRSDGLAGLVAEDGTECSIEVLTLNNTAIDDDAAPYIACCKQLSRLGLASTRITKDGLFTIIDACPRLENIKLTSCRGVKLQDRKRIFELWEEEWQSR
ncbi:RNI-like protein [Schizophyllum commune Tattone D]|nr:RNI-like protein [Schizophyllum commune Tattone D]